MRRLLRIVALFAALVMPAVAAGDEVFAVEAEGHAFVAAPGDRDAARRRALGEALVSAALSGGASLRGHTAMNKGRITADLSILRPTGRILSHRVLSADLSQGRWTVRVLATVGPMPVGACAGRRRLTISATPPEIRVAPDASAWAGPLAKRVAQDLADTLRRHSGVDLDRIAPVADTPVSSALDYTALTRGRPAAAAGDHRLGQDIRVIRDGDRLVLTLGLSLAGQDGSRVRRDFRREAGVPSGGLAGLVSGRSRSRAESELTRGLMSAVTGWLDALTCAPAAARIVRQGETLSVPLGRRHGLTRASLAFIDDPDDSFGLLEVVTLGNRETVLRPLDPTRGAGSFAGRRVYFVEAGL